MRKDASELLLKDLSCRVPYNLIMRDKYGHEATLKEVNFDYGVLKLEDKSGSYIEGFIINWKPYLRSPSSMTENDRKELELLSDCYTDDNGTKHYFHNVTTIDWMYKKHIDCRELIKLRLAIGAPEGMYN